MSDQIVLAVKQLIVFILKQINSDIIFIDLNCLFTILMIIFIG